MALSVIPPVGWSLAWFQAEPGSAEELLERLRALSPKHFNAQLAHFAERQSLPSWARNLGADKALREQFVDGLAGLYSVLVAPYEAPLTELFMGDRAVRMRQLVSGGVERLLAELAPQWLRWNPPVLEVRMVNRIEFDLKLDGRGILLVPSMFGTRAIVDDDAQPQPTLSYPAGHDQPLRRLTTFAPGASKSMSAISALLGKTRAAVLTTIAEHPGCSTKELASFVGIAPASASEHATILRNAGLVTTSRYRNAAVHHVTELGAALLNQL